ncbi:putative Aspartyl/glutamyl-tRNA synthetase /YqeY-like protein [Klebsiella phage 05F01]|nr:putative Aspartyl/glutamyl-tRNA synthetase /YqeY-like protein [Klebsiella phage 05F01]
MSIVTQMKADRIVARVSDKGTFALLTNIIGEYDLARTQKANLSKSEDDVMTKVVKVGISHAKEQLSSLQKVGAPQSQIERAMRDIVVLENYLPEMLSEEDLRDIAENSKLLGWKMPDMMRHLREGFPNCYDGDLAVKIAKEVLDK